MPHNVALPEPSLTETLESIKASIAELEDKVEKILVETLFQSIDTNYLETRLNALEARLQKALQRMNENPTTSA